jgi:hypothetical protein
MMGWYVTENDQLMWLDVKICEYGSITGRSFTSQPPVLGPWL